MSFLGAIGTIATGGLWGGAAGESLNNGKISGPWTPWSTPGDGYQMEGSPPALPTDKLEGVSASIGTPDFKSNELAQEGQNYVNSMDQASTQANSSTQNAWDQMAMGGGIRSGAAERVAEQGGIGKQLATQQVGQGSANRRLGIDIAANNSNIDAQKFNAGMGLQKAMGQNAFNQGIYNTQGQMYAAKNIAGQQEYDQNNKSLWDKIF